MAKSTEAHKKAVLKYRKESTHSLVLIFPNKKWKVIESYCKYINMPIATWVRSLIWNTIESDASFTYSEEDGNEN